MNDEQKLRQLLWLHHGHQGLYGDDGEMQCNLFLPPGVMPCDFKRASIDQIEDHLNPVAAALRRNLEAWSHE